MIPNGSILHIWQERCHVSAVGFFLLFIIKLN